MASPHARPPRAAPCSPLRRYGALLLPLALGLGGCDDEPVCRISAVFSGGFQGPGDWNSEGRENCGFANTAALAPDTTALIFVDESNERESVYVMVEQTSVGPGILPGRMIYTYEGNVWASLPGSCSVNFEEFEIEDWSQIDFIRYEGAVFCPDPLVPVDPEQAPVSMSDITFNGHVHAEVLTYPFP